MTYAVTSELMKRLDSLTINEFGIPSRVLMENAGKGCAEFLRNNHPQELEDGVVVLCGSGNNGGDGYVIARWLSLYGYDINIIRAGGSKSSPETTANRDLCEKMGIESYSLETEGAKKLAGTLLSETGIIIDALYGIGFKGVLGGEVAELVKAANQVEAIRVAVDVPSGVDADTGRAELAFNADLTLTMAAIKYGHLIGDGKYLSGWVEVIPIGIPELLWQKEKPAFWLDEETAVLPERYINAHKGDYGRIAVLAGSPGFTGAAFMAASAALKAGAGLVTIFCHPDHLQHYCKKPYEVMVKTTPLQQDGEVDEAALDKELSKFDVVLYGPGCGVSDYALQLLNWLVKRWNKPAVIDADGLNNLAQNKEFFNDLAGKQVILTPHWGEFCRLADLNMEVLKENCVPPLKEFVEKNGLKVLLKSDTSIYYDGSVMYFNTTGNDGLATGGSGDVLSGLIAGFLGQKMPCPEAAGSAAFFLGITAEFLSEKQETNSITPSDILNQIFRYDAYETDKNK